MCLILEDIQVKGVVMYYIWDGDIVVFWVKVVMFVIGGYGWVFNIIFNDYVLIGDGLVMAVMVGLFF